MPIARVIVLSMIAMALAAGRAEAACATGLTEIIDARGKTRCVAADRLRAHELRRKQRLETRAVQDGQTQSEAQQRALARALPDEQTYRINSLRADQRRREVDLRK